ncbi:hypothetical protein ACO0DA_12110 [Bacillus subtilis]|uniref:hypothetical protein n=1 Tax=Bacillus subtilis group TaxID=653685 RepID=UPI00100A0CD0|nr:MULTISPECIES: hypothetical protein [Bacillus subtilis group]MCY9397604.1 hypothetical protein [Bacillus inaquosorum]MEC0400816.1 hypothetical protein [Bacillus subtilis]QAW06613.1 hypothetical protein ES968_21860 [Bacillus subtilis]
MKSFNDISPIEGVYSDFIYLKEHALVSIIKVSGTNVDLLSQNMQNQLFDSYGAFLAQYAHYNIQTESMTVPVMMGGFIKKWKERYVAAKDDPNMTNEKKQLIASYLCEYQKSETDLDTAVKAHFVILKEKLKQPTIENLRVAEKRLVDKRDEVVRSLHSFLSEYDCILEILTAKEALSLLHQFLDYRTSVFSQ